MATNFKLIPSPKFISEKESYSFHGTGIKAGGFSGAADIFCFYANKILQISFTQGEDIILVENSSLESGEYKLKTNAAGITISVSDSYGASYAFATLLQISEVRDNKLFLPDVEIWDKPDCDYRGVMIDCARNHHPVNLLKKYVDMCWLYKIKNLHLHLTDDESYTLPSKLFPLLTTPHNCFTSAEISELCEYAESRSVQLVPEIDSPGHSEVIRSKYPETFGKEGILGFHEESISAMQDIYRELCDMFPYSEYIHIGGDESRLGWWLDCEECIEYGRSIGIKLEDKAPGMPDKEYVMLRYLAYFIDKMGEAIRKKGRKPLVWEGFNKAVNHMVSKDITVMVFESFYQLAPSLLADGFKIINCSWKPTYVVTPSWQWSKKECYDWDTHSFSAICQESPYYGGIMKLDLNSDIIGGQLSSWGDTLGTAFGSLEAGLADEMEKISERAPAIAENTWNREKNGNYGDFLCAYNKCRSIQAKMNS